MAYVMLLSLNTGLNAVRRRLGFSYWSLSAYLKNRTKKAVEYVGRFETALTEEARRQRVDGVVCGHIHTAEIKDRSEEHTSELQSLMRISYAVFCLKKKKNKTQ